MTIKQYQVAVIGAGPAGLRAAITAAKAGLTTLLIDDQPAIGGQVYRNLAQNEDAAAAYLGSGYFAGTKLLATFSQFDGVYWPQTTVWQITNDHQIAITRNSRAALVDADHIVIATGAIERSMPVSGWTLPGVMTVGGAQTLLKQAAVGAEHAVFVGNGPLLYLTAAQYIRAGLPVRAVLDTTGPKAWRAAAAHAALALFQPAMLAKGLSWLSTIRRHTRYVAGVTAVQISGDDAATALSYETAGGQSETIDTAHVFLHHGVIPNINLTMATGLDHVWDRVNHCWRPVVDQTGQSSNPAIYIAGDGGGIAGAAMAALSGAIAADAIIRRVKPAAAKPLATRLGQRFLLWQRGAARPFLDRLYHPDAAFRLPLSDDTIVCRCESVTKADIAAALGDAVAGPNQLKAFCRAGMGRCQGRSCGLIVQEMIANDRQQTMADTGYYRVRPPVKPVTLAELASLDGPWPG